MTNRRVVEICLVGSTDTFGTREDAERADRRMMRTVIKTNQIRLSQNRFVTSRDCKYALKVLVN